MKDITKLNLENYRFGQPPEIDFTSARTNLFLLTGLFALVTIGIGVPQTREFTKLILDENNVVEVLTFVACLIGGGFGLQYAYQLFKEKENPLFVLFFAIFSIGLIFIGMEEISWGQQFLGFATPESFAVINEQKETTLHNINGMSGNSEYLRLLYGIGGAFGVLLLAFKPLRKIAVPFFLLPWFLVIAGHSVVDVFNDIVPIHKNFDALISELAELVEMLIAFSALIYIYYRLKTYTPSKIEEV